MEYNETLNVSPEYGADSCTICVNDRLSALNDMQIELTIFNDCDH